MNEGDRQEICRAAALIRQGGVVAFPTESWYGLAVDPMNGMALERLYAVKKRPADKPILLIISDAAPLKSLVSGIPYPYPALMDAFWPGPLTLVFPAGPAVSRRLAAGTGTVALRYSSHPVARELAALSGGIITATSANISGTPPHATARGVREDLGSEVDLILDQGRTMGDAGSTVVGRHGGRLCCLRPGQIPFSDIQRVASRPDTSTT